MARHGDQSSPQRHRHDHERAPAPPFRVRARRNGASYADVEPAFADDDVVRPDDVSIDEVVERLSRDISEAVNRAPFDERDELRSYAREIVREDTAPSGVAPQPPAKRVRLSFVAVATWLAVAGALLAFLIPPAGIVCFFMAGVAAVLAVILGPGDGLGARAAGHDQPPGPPPA